MSMIRKMLALALVLCLCMGLMIPSAFAVEDETTPPAESDGFDPYVFVYWPDASIIPDYYEPYAKAFFGMSAHTVRDKDETEIHGACLFNLVNTGILMEDAAQAPAGSYATVNVLCADYNVSINPGHRYRLLNLEDGYFQSQNSAAASHLRAIMRHTFPAVTPAEVEAAANAYLTATYGEAAVAVNGLTGGELLSASQAAVWHYTNGIDFGYDPYCHSEFWYNLGALWQDYYTIHVTNLEDPINAKEFATDYTRTNIAGVYEYLVNLPGEEYLDIVITDSAVSILGTVKQGNDQLYDLTVVLGINGTIDHNDELTLTASFGGQTQTFALGKDATLHSRSIGTYAITFTGLSERTRSSDVLSLSLTGTQSVQDVAFYEAQPMNGISAKDSSQNLVGVVSTTVPVQTAGEFEIDIPKTLEITKVDAASGNPLPGVAFDLYVIRDGDSYRLNTYVTDETGLIRVDVADDGSEYYFAEVQAPNGYLPVDGSVTGGTVVNTMDTGALEISKKVINASDAQDHEFFNFKVTVDLADAPVMGNGFAWLDETYIAQSLTGTKQIQWTVSGDKEITAQFTLQADESITIGGIPVGASSTVEEVVTEDDRQVFSVTAEVTAGNGSLVDGTDNMVSGTIAQQNAVLYTNEFVEVAEETTIPETTIPETTVPETTVPRDPTSPPTGDDLPMLMALCLLSMMLTAALYISKRYHA